MQRPTLRERLYDGETAVGTFQLASSPMVAEILADAGMDFVILDQEHGPLTAETCAGLTMSVERGGASTVVRVRSNSESEIQRALDIGADAVEIPQIETVEDAEAARDAARFSPVGERGLSQYVRAGGYVGHEDYTEQQNEDALVVIHIEGQEGVDNLDGILDVDGIDVVFIGPYDLSQSLGMPGEVRSEEVEETMADIVERTRDAGRIVGTYADDPEMAERWIDVGVQFVALSVDVSMFHHAAADLYDGVEK